MKILISIFLSVLLINFSYSKAEGTALEPRKIIQISPEQMKSLLNNPEVRRFAQVKTIEQDKEKKKKSDEDQTPTINNSSVDVFLNAPSGGSTDKEVALIVFAIVGAVVVIAWIPYFVGVTAKLIKGERDQLEFRHLFTTQFTQLTTDRNGKLIGGRYGLYANDKEEKTYATYGLSFESGFYESSEKNNRRVEEYRHGAYWLLGPSLFFEEGSILGKLDLLAGSSFDQNLGFVSKAEVSLNWKFESGFMLGLSLGGLYFNVKDKYGVLDHSNDLGFTYGLVSGFSF